MDGSDSLVFVTYALAAAYAGDFIITGILGQKFEQHKNALRERFRWSFMVSTKVSVCVVFRVHKIMDPYDCS